MNNRALACLLTVALLAACSSDNTSGSASGSGGAGTGAGTGLTDNNGGLGAGGRNGQFTPGSEQELAQSVGDRVFFNTDSSSLTPQALATLDRQANWLQQYQQVNIWVAGNCDERGTEEYNLALGQRRANAARDYLVARGVNSARIHTISYGKERPVALGSDEQAWAQNRRAVTVLNASS